MLTEVCVDKDQPGLRALTLPDIKGAFRAVELDLSDADASEL